jgi:hypothetical protein
MSEINAKHKNYFVASLVALVLLSSSLLVPTLSAYADKGNDKPKSNDSPKILGNHDDHHKKGKKDPDKDKDNDKKKCKNGDTNKNGKYKHNCDSDHDFK